ncbi:MAG TPA: SDR family oxidoreductase [Dehalococcoidia bacterium]|nr:SDR family oxidoreductase [Dehalococcoidia bacterium]
MAAAANEESVLKQALPADCLDRDVERGPDHVIALSLRPNLDRPFVPQGDKLNNLWRDENAGGDAISQLVYLSNLIGADEDLVQPGGGNTSVKLEVEDVFGCRVHALAVKGSGTALRTITPAGFTHLYLDRLATLRERDAMSDEEMMALMRASMLFVDRDPAPSVETPLHSIIPYRFVAHTHDVATLSLTDTPSAWEHVERVFGADVAFLEYVRPGFPLAKRMAERYGDGPPASAIGLAMEKHGLCTWGETAKECYANLVSIITRAEEYVAEHSAGKKVFAGDSPIPAEPERRSTAARLAPLIRGNLARLGWRCVLAFDDSAEVLEAVSSPEFPELASRGVMTPEHIMRSGRQPLVLDPGLLADPAVGAQQPAEPHSSADEIAEVAAPLHPANANAITSAFDDFRAEYEAYLAANGQTKPIPDWLKVIAVPGVGAFFAGKDRRSALVAATCYKATLRAMAGAEAIEFFASLPDADVCEMEYWPLERRKIEEGLKASHPLDGKIALVIGAASGIGLATAQRFAAEGAHVTLADLDLDRAQAAADAIKEFNAERAYPLTANAADPEAMEDAVRETCLRFGGIDVLFYSPGVPPELHPVADMGDEEVEVQLRVHFKGAVAATRAASQDMLAAGLGGRLIYNASKAAFAPGEGAAAYGAAKAALVHYVRNAANELSRHGITANYINADAIDTPLFRALVKERSERSGQSEEQTLARYAERSLFHTATVPASAVAEAALWLASDVSAYTSGCVITVGGGAEGMPR